MKRMVLLLSVLVLVCAGFASAAINVVEAPTGFFVPTDAQRYDDPYYRWYGMDWGWTHGAMGGAITSAKLNISAFDVDYAQGERDAIYAYDGASKVFLGHLIGLNDAWAFTEFSLGANFFDDIATGLKVFMEIDIKADGWAVTLAKSSLTTDGTNPGNPEPGAVPEPSTYMLMAAGVAGLVFFRKRFQK